MASIEKMNNKIKVSKFWAMGGVCCVELWPDVPYNLGEPWLYYADSLESLVEIRRKLVKIKHDGEKLFRTRIEILRQIRRISFRVGGFWYEHRYGSIWQLEDNDYLYIKERVYK